MLLIVPFKQIRVMKLADILLCNRIASFFVNYTITNNIFQNKIVNYEKIAPTVFYSAFSNYDFKL